MTVDAATLFIPGNATVFHAPPATDCPATPLDVFKLQGAAPSGWDNLGHTSRENMINFSREGGDATPLDTALATAVRTIYSSEAWTLNVPALQIDTDVLDLAYAGEFDDDNGYIIPGSNVGTERALFLLFHDSTGQLGFYIPSTSVKLGDVPSFDDNENFAEHPLAAAIQSVPEDVIPAVNGIPAIMKLYKTGLAAA